VLADGGRVTLLAAFGGRDGVLGGFGLVILGVGAGGGQ
jgi:hypothetical protein